MVFGTLFFTWEFSSYLTSLWVSDRVKLEVDLLVSLHFVPPPDTEEEQENMAILALTLLAIWLLDCWPEISLLTLLPRPPSLFRSRLPVELADDLRLRISEFWKRSKPTVMRAFVRGCLILYGNFVSRHLWDLKITFFLKILLYKCKKPVKFSVDRIQNINKNLSADWSFWNLRGKATKTNDFAFSSNLFICEKKSF